MKSALVLLISAVTLFGAMDVQKIAEKIELLSADQTLEASVNYHVYDPFKRAKPLLAKINEKPKDKRLEPIRVDTILNNRALVDGKWVKRGAVIHGARVIAIKKDAIIVQYDEKEVLIPQNRAKSIISTRELQK
jgi:hypothetical protein